MKSSKLHLCVIAAAFVVLSLAAVPRAEAACTEGSIKNHTHGCCGLNNKKHSWNECHNNQWFLVSYCDYADCCAYPCGMSSTVTSAPSFLTDDNGLLGELLGDKGKGNCSDRSLGFLTTTPEEVLMDEATEPVEELSTEPAEDETVSP